MGLAITVRTGDLPLSHAVQNHMPATLEIQPASHPVRVNIERSSLVTVSISGQITDKSTGDQGRAFRGTSRRKAVCRRSRRSVITD